LTDKAADWVYRGAKAAGFFSYSSEEERLTEFSFSTKDGTHMQPSDLSESVITGEAADTVVGQPKFWIQTKSSSVLEESPAIGEIPTLATANGSTAVNESIKARRSNKTHRGTLDNEKVLSLDHFRKILLLAERLNVSPQDLIKRLEEGELLESLLK
jgi:hypothetical protein